MRHTSLSRRSKLICVCCCFPGYFVAIFPSPVSFVSSEGNLTKPRWRLVNGSTPAEGRLEYQTDEGDWACVCVPYRLNYEKLDALNNLCKELGFKHIINYYQFSSTFLFGICLGRVFEVEDKDGRFSAMPPVSCFDPTVTIGLRCTDSK